MQQKFEESAPHVHDLEETLDSEHPQNQPLVAQGLQAMESEAIEDLLRVLAEEGQARRKRRWWVAVGVGAYLALALLVAMLTRSSAMFNAMGGLMTVMLAALAASDKQKNTAKMLAKFDDVRAVGPLAEALEFNDKDVNAAAESALEKLLPRLQASDAGVLNPEQRACLHRVLTGKTAGKNTPLALAVLKALEQVGDSKALPLVEKLAEGEGKAAKHPQIRDAAQACLPYLRLRVEQERASQTLLRAASAMEAGSETLLRPASGTSSVEADALLRASEARPD